MLPKLPPSRSNSQKDLSSEAEEKKNEKKNTQTDSSSENSSSGKKEKNKEGEKSVAQASVSIASKPKTARDGMDIQQQNGEESTTFVAKISKVKISKTPQSVTKLNLDQLKSSEPVVSPRWESSSAQSPRAPISSRRNNFSSRTLMNNGNSSADPQNSRHASPSVNTPPSPSTTVKNTGTSTTTTTNMTFTGITTTGITTTPTKDASQKSPAKVADTPFTRLFPLASGKPSQRTLNVNLDKLGQDNKLGNNDPAPSPRFAIGSSRTNLGPPPLSTLPPLPNSPRNATFVSPRSVDLPPLPNDPEDDAQFSSQYLRNNGNSSADPQNSRHASPSVTTTASTSTTVMSTGTTTTTTATNSSQQAVKSERKSYVIPELAGKNRKAILEPKLLAKQLMIAESWNYERPLKGSVIETILRQKVALNEKFDNEKIQPGEDAIEVYLEPFMNHFYDTPSVNQKLKDIQESYERQQAEIAPVYANSGGGNKFARSEEGKKLMLPVIAPIIEFICGKNNSVETCGLPKPVLAMMLAVDEEVQKWFAKSGTGNPEDLKTARENALKSFFGTRSFMAKFTIGLSMNKAKPDGFYRPLVSYLNTYLNIQIDDFVQSLMNCKDETKKQIAKESQLIMSRPVLAKTKQQQLLDNTTHSVLNKENDKSVSTGKEALNSKPKSDRDTLVSPRRQYFSGVTKEDEANRANLISRKKQTAVIEYLDTLKLSQYEDFSEKGEVILGFNRHVQAASREDYRAFKENPNDFFFQFINAFGMNKRLKLEPTSPALRELVEDVSFLVSNAPESQPGKANQDE
jgi:hypothetical protein